MRTADTLLCVAATALCLVAGPAFAFDGSVTESHAMPRPPEVASLPPPGDAGNAGPLPPANIPNVPPVKEHLSAAQAFRSGARWLKKGDTHKAVVSLEYAAENGHPLAQWKLGRMYAMGDGVAHNDLKAFKYFESIVNHHAGDDPDTRQAPFVANAFVALGRYYLEGIPHSSVKRDPALARRMFSYAASYFRDPNAQYDLARLYFNGVGAPFDRRTAARWFRLSAQKGKCQAQAMLGAMLFYGDHVPRQAARGLMWLTLAKDSAKDLPVPDQSWIDRLYSSTMKQASEDDRALAGIYLKRWLEHRRD
jgi:hypothetical protein